MSLSDDYGILEADKKEKDKAVIPMNETKVLLVEDDSAIVENLSAVLKTEGFLVSAASGQSRALELLEEERFSLVLLDVTLAEGNGYSTCTAIKAKHDLPVIFLTALGDEFSVVTGLDMGADDKDAVGAAKGRVRKPYDKGRRSERRSGEGRGDAEGRGNFSVCVGISAAACVFESQGYSLITGTAS